MKPDHMRNIERSAVEITPAESVPAKRVLGLFAPYRTQIAIVTAVITLSAIVALGSPLLLREMLDKAIRTRTSDSSAFWPSA